MNDLSLMTTFLGWCTLINYGILILSTVMLLTCGNWIKSVHGKLFNLSEANLGTIYFSYLGNYKLAIFLFNLAPYIALKIMA
jgi:hypothetical protein